jgi:hypothetical protein
MLRNADSIASSFVLGTSRQGAETCSSPSYAAPRYCYCRSSTCDRIRRNGGTQHVIDTEKERLPFRRRLVSDKMERNRLGREQINCETPDGAASRPGWRPCPCCRWAWSRGRSGCWSGWSCARIGCRRRRRPRFKGGCPRCGQPLAPGAAQGLCPACLLRQAAQDFDGVNLRQLERAGWISPRGAQSTASPSWPTRRQTPRREAAMKAMNSSLHAPCASAAIRASASRTFRSER